MNVGGIVVGFALALSACGAEHKQTWSAAQVYNEQVRITPGNVTVSRDRLYVEVTLFNTTDKAITIERDAVTLNLQNGRTLRRSVGITSRHNPYTVPPGGSQAVHVDFLAEGFEWMAVPAAEVDYSKAVFAGATPVAVPTLL